MAITRSQKTPIRKIGKCRTPLAPLRTGGPRTKVRVTGRNLLGAFTAALTPRTPVRRSALLCNPPTIHRKGSRASHHIEGRVLFAETPCKTTPSALLAPDAPRKAPKEWIREMGRIWDSVMLPPLTA
jgi:hypothetical protein